MGSYAEATMTGFICRLCSEHKKSVIHFYSAKAKKLELLKKLTLLPITIEKFDNLPKTICNECINKLNLQYKLIMRIRKSFELQKFHMTYHTNGNCPVGCPFNGVELSPLDDNQSSSDYLALQDNGEGLPLSEPPSF